METIRIFLNETPPCPEDLPPKVDCVWKCFFFQIYFFFFFSDKDIISTNKLHLAHVLRAIMAVQAKQRKQGTWLVLLPQGLAQ